MTENFRQPAPTDSRTRLMAVGYCDAEWPPAKEFSFAGRLTLGVHSLDDPPTKEEKMARHYVAAAAVAVLVAVALASPAFAAKASLTPSVHHVRCPDQAVSAGSVFCETVTLTNTSGFTIHVDHWTLTGSDVVDFESSNSPCGASTLNPYPDAGDSCVLNVYFDPSATGHRSATAEFIESTFGSTTSVGLAGRGT